eukprot:838495-Pleurochrysis_carterae.AAC.1
MSQAYSSSLCVPASSQISQTCLFKRFSTQMCQGSVTLFLQWTAQNAPIGSFRTASNVVIGS